MTLPDKDILIAEAKTKAGLSDFGDPWFFGHLDVLIPALNSQAKLSEAGAFGARHMIVSSLEKRLRHIELLKQHPEIEEETVNVRAVLTGLPRTGSTMLHRMLAAAPELTGIKWHETQNYVPLPDEEKGDPSPRREAAEGILAYMLDVIPELMSIHPMSIDQPDEEVIILGQLFSSSMIESTYFVPDYAEWLSKQDARPAYEDLISILKSLQWQDQSRAGKDWVLKTPGHLMALDAVLEVFGDAKIVMTHRDPVATVPSYCSMEASLYRLGSDEISGEEIGSFWHKRLGQWLDHFMQVRAVSGEARFIDVVYPALLSDPIGEGLKVLEFTGIPYSDTLRSGMEDWIEANRREHRAPHRYAIEDFGLSEDQIKSDFSVYRANYLGET